MQYEAGKIPVTEIYIPFNDYVLRGKPAGFISHVVDEFASASANKADARVLRHVRAAHEDGAFTGVLSTSYEDLIRSVLRYAGYGDVFDDIVANNLETTRGGDNQQIAVGFTLGIYGQKEEIFKRKYFDSMRFNPSKTFYLGDSSGEDEPIASLLPRGHFIVPFFANPAFRFHMHREHGAFYPVDEKDLDRYLKLK